MHDYIPIYHTFQGSFVRHCAKGACRFCFFILNICKHMLISE